MSIIKANSLLPSPHVRIAFSGLSEPVGDEHEPVFLLSEIPLGPSMPREPISQIFENMPEFCPIDGLQKSRIRDQPVTADIIDIQGRGLRGGPKDDSQSFLETHGRL